MRALAMGVQDRPRAMDAKVLIRGELDKPAQVVSRGFLQVFPHTEVAAKPSRDSSGRLEFAHWLTARENPLTARVMVNRVWQKLFDRGLVASLNDFGATGQRPTHPELLDTLAVQFMEDHWSIKGLIRALVQTRTYRQSTRFDGEAYLKDPDNALLWRMPPRRMDAEALRDNMLVASAKIDLERPRLSTITDVGDTTFGRRLTQERLDRSTTYRSVYLPMVRDGLPSALDLFDAADPNRVTGNRETTNVPSQALYLMNNPFVIEQGDGFAQRLVREAETPNERVNRAYLIAFGRLPEREESQVAMQFLRQFAREAGQKPERSRRSFRARFRSRDRVQPGFQALSAFAQSLLASAEFRYLN